MVALTGSFLKFKRPFKRLRLSFVHWSVKSLTRNGTENSFLPQMHREVLEVKKLFG